LLYNGKDMEVLLTGRMYNEENPLLAEITVEGTNQVWYTWADRLITRRRKPIA
jgi:hypothetical protein